MFVGVVRKVRAELGRVYGRGCVFGVVRTVQSLKASVCVSVCVCVCVCVCCVCVVCVCVCVWDCKNGTKLSCVCSGFLIQRHGVVLGIGSDVRGY